MDLAFYFVCITLQMNQVLNKILCSGQNTVLIFWNIAVDMRDDSGAYIPSIEMSIKQLIVFEVALVINARWEEHVSEFLS
jgi:hypothetical protein